MKKGTVKKEKCHDCGKLFWYLHKDKWCWECYNENTRDDECMVCGRISSEVLNRICDACWHKQESRRAQRFDSKYKKQYCTKCKTRKYDVVAGVCQRCSVLIGLPPLKSNPEVFHANRVELKEGERQKCHA